MKILKGKSRRTVIFTVITVALIIIAIALNALLTYFGGLNTLYADVTERGIYSLSGKMVEECAFIDELGETDGDKCVKVTFCTDPDYLTEASVTRATYFMALNMQKRFDNFEVETVNHIANPTALAKYKTTSLTTFSSTDIIVSYGDRYRKVTADNFWLSDYTLYNGEYTLATLVMSVTAIEQPAAYFVTGHGETVYDPKNPEGEGSLATAALYDLLAAQGLRVGVVDLATDAIPDDCTLLIINDPTSDFAIDGGSLSSMNYLGELEKIEKYLINDQGSLMVARDPSMEGKLTNLDDFLFGWGFSFGSSTVVDNESSTEGGNTEIITVYNTDENSFANAIYKDYTSISTSPKTVIKNTGYIETSYIENGNHNEAGSGDAMRTYNSFLTTSPTAASYFTDEAGALTSAVDKKGAMDLAAVTARMWLDTESTEHTNSFVFCAASADFFSNSLLGNAAYGNYDVTSALVNTISRTDVYASMDLGGESYNSSSVGGKQIFEDTMEADDWQVIDINNMTTLGTKQGMTDGAKVVYTVIFMLAPAAALVLGVFVCVRRRFL